MKRISEEKRKNIVNLLEKGVPARQIARQLQVDGKAVRKIQDEVCPAAKKSKSGCPAKISEATIRRIQRAVISGKASTATKVVCQLRSDVIAIVHSITVKILDDEFLQTLDYYGCKKEETIFQQDNDPKHTSRLAKRWFEENEVEILERPP